MRAEDVVGLSFFLGAFVGIGVILRGFRQPKGAPQRGRWQGSGLIIVSLAFLTFSVLTIYFIRTSARPVIVGNVWALANGGVRIRGSSFNVTGDSGAVVKILSVYDGPGLREGDRARVRYVQYNRRLTEFTALSGPYTGWHFEESPGERTAVAFTVIGLLCGLVGWRLLAREYATS